MEQERERKESQTEVTKSVHSVDPEAPMRGLNVGNQERRVINLTGLACPGCLVPHWVCSGGPLHQRRAAAAAESCSVCNKSSSEREIRQGEEKKTLHGFMASSPLHGLKIMTCEEV